MKAILVCICVLGMVVTLSAADSNIGVLPKDGNGRPLNLDFEDGTLRDWKATGTAFEKLDLTPEEKAGIMSGNARKVLGGNAVKGN